MRDARPQLEITHEEDSFKALKITSEKAKPPVPYRVVYTVDGELSTVNKFFNILPTMSHRTYPILYLLLSAIVLGCGPSKNGANEFNFFITEWSHALTTRDKSIQRFYDPAFVFPKDIFNNAAALKYSFDLEHIVTLSAEDNGDLVISVPYHLTYPDNSTEDGGIELTIIKTEKGYLISDMSQQLARSLMEYTLRQTRADHPQAGTYDSLSKILETRVRELRQRYDSVVFYSNVNDQLLFYVVNGNWVFPYDYDASKQSDGGNYKIGVVTGENKVIIPVSYSKIYNPDGSFEGMIEVENDGKRGLFRTNGEIFFPQNLMASIRRKLVVLVLR